MPKDDRSYHRQQRMAAIARWSVAGVQEPRSPLPIETAFKERLAKCQDPVFRPLAVADAGGVEFHRQVSYLVDAFDSFPDRVDVAFDSTWKAFESASRGLVSGNITDRLKKLGAGTLDGDVFEQLLGCIPVQSCEYLFKRLVTDFPEPGSPRHLQHQPNRRLRDLKNSDIDYLVVQLHARYATDELADHRKGAILLQRALRGEMLILGSEELRLNLPTRSAILLSGLLYTARNDRFHGESFSPFVSSAASIRTYTHPYFLFLASYSLLLTTWAATPNLGAITDLQGVGENLQDNIASAQALFGHHWRR